MKVAILLKSGPDTVKAERALTIASDMLLSGHSVTLALLQEAVHFCREGLLFTTASRLRELMDQGLAVQALIPDCSLRGIKPPFSKGLAAVGDYDKLVELIESADRTIGIL